MKKAEILKQLRSAKAAHINWVQRAKLLISGFNIDEASIPVNSTECLFGQWFYKDAQILKSLHNNPIESMEEIEKLHFQLHDIYLNIFKIYYKIDKQGFFSRLFGSKKRISDTERAEAGEYFKELEEVSKALIEEIDLLEKRIHAVGDKELDGLV